MCDRNHIDNNISHIGNNISHIGNNISNIGNNSSHIGNNTTKIKNVTLPSWLEMISHDKYRLKYSSILMKLLISRAYTCTINHKSHYSLGTASS